MKKPRLLLIISLIVFVISVLIMCVDVKKRWERFVVASATVTKPSLSLYYRISDTLDYTKPVGDAIKPFLDLAVQFPQFIKSTPTYQKATWVMFETLNNVDKEMGSMTWPKTVAYIYGVAGSDLLASKSLLAITLTAASLDTLQPLTYITENGIGKDKFLADYEKLKGKSFILKKNIQRQEGCMITGDLQVVAAAFDPTSGYVVCQELLQNPLVITEASGIGRKVNVRIYLLVIVSPVVGCTCYMYNDGFMYYTPSAFVAGSLDAAANITTGYIDRQVYIDNPLTFNDLLLKVSTSQASILYNNTIAALTNLAAIYKQKFTEANKNIPGIKFNIFGVDIAPANDYTVKIMEVNKGPDLSYKDDRDELLKKTMVAEMLGIVGILPRATQNFITL